MDPSLPRVDSHDSQGTRIFVLLETLDHRARRIESVTLFPLVITTRAEWRDDSGGVKFAINNNDNKLSEGERSAAWLLNRVSIDGLERVAIATDNALSLPFFRPVPSWKDRRRSQRRPAVPFRLRFVRACARTRTLHALGARMGQPPMVARTGRNLDSSMSSRAVGVNVATCCHLSSALLIHGRWPAWQ